MSQLHDYAEIVQRCLVHIWAAQGALRFECLRIERGGRRAQLLDVLEKLSLAEGMLVDTFREPVHWKNTFNFVSKSAKNSLHITEQYYGDLVEAPGLNAHLEAILALLPAEPAPAIKATSL